MLTRRIIPCLDVRDGRVVKGIKFQGLRDAGDPPELAASYEAQGADELVILDVSATPEGRATAIETVRKVRERLSIPITVGGGVRSPENAQALLEAGADKVGTNTAAVRNPALVTEIANRFGSQCAVVAIDAGRREGAPGWEVIVTSGRERTGIDAVEWAREVVGRGAGEILLTSWDRDGTRTGYDLELLAAISSAVNVPVIASGGAATPEHLLDGIRAGADAVLAASIFHYGEYTVATLKDYLISHGVAIRQ
jgi:imidazoleglycerol phosphate synthase cyclase subunit